MELWTRSGKWVLDGRHGLGAHDGDDHTPSRSNPSHATRTGWSTATTDTHESPTTTDHSARVGTTRRHGRTFGSQRRQAGGPSSSAQAALDCGRRWTGTHLVHGGALEHVPSTHRH
jgi:hypothetical protein